MTPSGLVIEQRAAFNSFDETPNANVPPPAPGTVGPTGATPGVAGALNIVEEGTPTFAPVSIIKPSAWSGWPSSWEVPLWQGWQGHCSSLTDTAWACLDRNSSILSTMPPYLVGAPRSLLADWLNNPDPDLYGCWEEFAKQVFWDYQCAGEVFILATARYATGWPARFHVVSPWLVDADIDGSGRRRYAIGQQDVTDDLLHIRYTSRVGDAHGRGPLEVAGPRLTAAMALTRYANSVASSGGIPHSVLKHPRPLTAEQSAALQIQWVEARMNSLGLPAVLSGGIEFETLQLNPHDMALVELSQWNEARIAVLLSVPPFFMALPSGGDSMTYSTVVMNNDYYWRAGLRPMAQTVMSWISGWALPRGTTVELNRDEFVRPGPLERAQTYEIMTRIGAMSVDEVRERERLTGPAPAPAPVEPEGVLV